MLSSHSIVSEISLQLSSTTESERGVCSWRDGKGARRLRGKPGVLWLPTAGVSLGQTMSILKGSFKSGRLAGSRKGPEVGNLCTLRLPHCLLALPGMRLAAQMRLRCLFCDMEGEREGSARWEGCSGFPLQRRGRLATVAVLLSLLCSHPNSGICLDVGRLQKREGAVWEKQACNAISGLKSESQRGSQLLWSCSLFGGVMATWREPASSTSMLSNGHDHFPETGEGNSQVACWKPSCGS